MTEMGEVVLSREEKEKLEAEVRKFKKELLEKLEIEVGEKKAAQRRAYDALARAAKVEQRMLEAERQGSSPKRRRRRRRGKPLPSRRCGEGSWRRRRRRGAWSGNSQ